MRHSWVFEVLSDLRDYAIANQLAALAAKVDEALELAREEIESPRQDTEGPDAG